MRNKTLYFESPEELERVVTAEYFYLAENLLVIILCANREKLSEIAQVAANLLPNAAIIGLGGGKTALRGDNPDEKNVILLCEFKLSNVVSAAMDELLLEDAPKLAGKIKASGAKHALIFSAQGAHDSEPFLRELGGVLQSAICIFSPEISISAGGAARQSGLVAALFNGNFEFLTRRGEAFMPFGEAFSVSKLSQERILELDGKPITELFASDLNSKFFMILDAESSQPIAEINGNLLTDAIETANRRVRCGVSLLEVEVRARSFLNFLEPVQAILRFGAGAQEKPKASAAFFGAETLILRHNFIERARDLWLSFSEDLTTALITAGENIISEIAARDHAVMRLLADTAAELAWFKRSKTSCEIPAGASVSSYDRLTRLPGRAAFIEHIAKAAEPAVALININRFHDINNLYGFAAGDALLAELAQVILARVEAESGAVSVRLFRTSGDTFSLLADKIDKQDFISRIERLLKEIARKIFLDSYQSGLLSTQITARAGLAFGDQQTISRAEIALGAAKARYISLAIASEDEGEKSRKNMRMLEMIRQATIQPWWVMAYFQPIASAATGEIVKYEGLIRIRDSEGKIHPPMDFLELAKRSRFYANLTRAMFKNSLEIFAGRAESVSLNLSPEDLQNAETMTFLSRLVAEYADPKQITIEITESEAIEDYDVVLAAICEIKSWGAKIAIDDFGSGYSNFSYIIKLRADYLKIDGSIVREIDADEKAYTTLTAIVDFAKRLNLETIAEFISTETIAKKAREAGVDYLQGYYIGKPAPF
ncbi:MAG: EAL domain-containing protein [Helicobacteraceae bacterium]|jgi:EAL domain-containing protein (putative c-di-GMP-specific phosphodiesterase class I)/GGDEF domain-containing protein|nr:EAL domain-containing protein [Helicobacteraceae bacterium]